MELRPDSGSAPTSAVDRNAAGDPIASVDRGTIGWPITAIIGGAIGWPITAIVDGAIGWPGRLQPTDSRPVDAAGLLVVFAELATKLGEDPACRQARLPLRRMPCP